MEIGTYLFEKNKLRDQDNYFKIKQRGDIWNTRQ